MAKKPTQASKKDQTIELRLPDELYDKIKKLEEAKLTSILKSVLGKKARVAIKKVGIKDNIKYVKISRWPKEIAATGMKRLEKKC